MKRERIWVYSYIKAWKVDKKIYSVQNWRLPFPVEPRFLFYFIGSLFLCQGVLKVIPGAELVPGVISYALAPYAIAKFLRTKKLDGKNPIFYLKDLILFLILDQGTVVEHFRKIPEKEKKIRLNWKCSKGY